MNKPITSTNKRVLKKSNNLSSNLPLGASGCNSPLSSGSGCNSPLSSGSGGCGNFNSGCIPTLGCLPSWAMGCQRIGCGLLSLLLALALLLALLKTCNNSILDSNNRENDEVRIDTVRVYEIDTVEKVVLDTLFSIDTVKLTDTMYTVIKNALPLPNVLLNPILLLLDRLL